MRQSVTPEMALKLAAAFQNTTADFWLTVQDRYDLAQARRKYSTENVRVMWEHA
jgi:addiction module HigA family antidote